MADLDGDGDIRTGWVVFYLHLANSSPVPLGKEVKAGDLLGLPSCEGGSATGTHVHIARMYNGEGSPPESGVLGLDGRPVAVDGEEPYKGFPSDTEKRSAPAPARTDELYFASAP